MVSFVGDTNDDWIVEMVKGERGYSSYRIMEEAEDSQDAIQANAYADRLLLVFAEPPDWGFQLQEVTCNQNAWMANPLLYIESATHPQMPENAPTTKNAGIADRHPFDSRPDSWPRLLRGIYRGCRLLRCPPRITNSPGKARLLGTRKYEGDEVRHTMWTSVRGMESALLPVLLDGPSIVLVSLLPALYFAVLLSCGVFDLVTSTLRPRLLLPRFLRPVQWSHSSDSQKFTSVTTIGGKPGGRGAVVTEDKLGKAASLPQAGDWVTTVNITFRQAEPGHDIFGAKIMTSRRALLLANPSQQLSRHLSRVEKEVMTEAESSTGTSDTGEPSAGTSADVSAEETRKQRSPAEEVETEAQHARTELFLSEASA
ncbi:hypothetical protein BC835DRAFT_1309525 [Cytidiella melzeri]|nr:hypothetical protein BC835DRAFT_1309525 [Cytidiella melzeri]